jgi:hypothetical protein
MLHEPVTGLSKDNGIAFTAEQTTGRVPADVRSIADLREVSDSNTTAADLSHTERHKQHRCVEETRNILKWASALQEGTVTFMF